MYHNLFRLIIYEYNYKHDYLEKLFIKMALGRRKEVEQVSFFFKSKSEM